MKFTCGAQTESLIGSQILGVPLISSTYLGMIRASANLLQYFWFSLIREMQIVVQVLYVWVLCKNIFGTQATCINHSHNVVKFS